MKSFLVLPQFLDLSYKRLKKLLIKYTLYREFKQYFVMFVELAA